jgi:exfoliative toxin A/B
MFIGVILYFPKMLKIKFYPSYSSFTFPMAISAIAMKQTNVFLTKIGRNIYLLKPLVKFEEILTIIIVIYVLMKYFDFLVIKEISSKNSDVNEAF